MHFTGRTEGSELRDDQFGVAVRGLALRRQPEIFQWVEKRHEHEDDHHDHGHGHGHKRVSYSYSQEWVGDPINSNNFHNRHHRNKRNPNHLPRDSRRTRSAMVDGVRLHPELEEDLLDFRRLELDHPGASRSKPGEQARAGGKHVAVASSVPSQYPVAHHGVLYSSEAAVTRPKNGDIRVGFTYVPDNRKVSVLGKMKKGKLGPYRAKNGKRIAIAKHGHHSAGALIQAEIATNTWWTWVFRGAGSLGTFLALMLVLSPVQYILGFLNWIPLVGGFASGILGIGVFVVALVVAVSLATTVIAVAWFVHRPLVSAAALAGVGGLVYGLAQLRKKGQFAAGGAPRPHRD